MKFGSQAKFLARETIFHAHAKRENKIKKSRLYDISSDIKLIINYIITATNTRQSKVTKDQIQNVKLKKYTAQVQNER